MQWQCALRFKPHDLFDSGLGALGGRQPSKAGMRVFFSVTDQVSQPGLWRRLILGSGISVGISQENRWRGAGPPRARTDPGPGSGISPAAQDCTPTPLLARQCHQISDFDLLPGADANKYPDLVGPPTLWTDQGRGIEPGAWILESGILDSDRQNSQNVRSYFGSIPT